MRAVWTLVFAAFVASATASEAPPRDAKSWALLVAAAKNRGGVETKLDKSSSYVFQQEDGDYLTLTEWRAPLKRFICVIAKDQKATVCVQWETGRTTYGSRADAASPWKTQAATSLEDTAEGKPTDGFFSILERFVGGALNHTVKFDSIHEDVVKTTIKH